MEKIRANNLKKYFRTGNRIIKAVDGVDIEINEREICALVGESGSGKSTLGKLILRIIEPDEGEIFFNGIDITKLDKSNLRAMRKKMQMIFQDPFTTFNPIYKIGNQIFEAIKFHKVVEDNLVEDYVVQLMRVVALHPDTLKKYPSQLSGGQLQRCAIVRAISLQPEFLICDEIVSSLDVSVQVQIIELLKVLKEEFKLTVLFITHDIGVARRIANRAFVMYSGKIVEKGAIEKIFYEPSHEYTKKLLGSVLSIKT
ncbi:ABC transporter ATP-binding protein [Candidatus Chrysopegis kryptomonas]|uniref:Peptide/nickel transport system ATP-binding protein n=1 Tax=Candidatus Chryseopegocella kryptomonas TaxID=1633643 RepID=A0A0P1MVZ6_9BACT|nr:ABC transporter ATP-binding protein [Candidatus Chrysopegis kryptomonas]CUS99808.1 peptide/nickel transport system ATP-binding protein [Candidatus Chrysopegis kryptomonas]